MEATGGLESPIAAELAMVGLSVAVINPRQARDFAKALGVLTRRRQLVEMITAESNRQHQTVGKIAKQIAKHLIWLKKRLAEADNDLDDAIAQSPLWKAKSDIVTSILFCGIYVNVSYMNNEISAKSEKSMESDPIDC